jgi:RecA/RadA recombinase
MITNSLLSKLAKNSIIKETSILSESTFFSNRDECPTPVHMINVALSGSLYGGLTAGLTVLAGPSKHFKTSFALLMASSYLEKHPDSVMLFYDSEFGSPAGYFDTFGIDKSRVLHTPVTDIEKLKFDLVNQLEGLESGDKVIVVIDSVGNLASKKELEDAISEKSAADMTRAKSLKSLFRMVTPYFAMKDIPILAVNHTYDTMAMYPTKVVSGGSGIYYSANTIWIIGRQQDKVGQVIEGYDFIINVEKSRFVREKSKIPISVSWDGGIEKYSGLLPIAIEGGFVSKPSAGWYCKVNTDTGELGTSMREKDTMNKEFWADILENPKFDQYLKENFRISHAPSIDEEKNTNG